jgi:hypothetical protein
MSGSITTLSKETAPPTANGRRRHHDERWKGTVAMKVEIEHEQLTDSEGKVLAEDGTRWKRMGAGAHLDDWLAYGPGLMLRRRMAMRIAFVNRPEGRGYAQAFGDLMQRNGLHTMDKTSVSAILWLHDEPERMTTLRQIRDTMTVGERARLNSPISARQRVEKILKVREAGQETVVKTSPLARQAALVAEQAREIEHLKEQLAAAERRDGSLFDLKRDSVDSIANTIVGSITAGRAESIARGVLQRLKQVRPAG